MKNHRSICGTAHARIRDAHHVLDTAGKEFGGSPMLPTSAIPDNPLDRNSAARARSFRRHRDGVVDALFIVLDGLKDDGAAAMAHEMRRRGGGFEHRSVGGKVAAQHRDPPCSTVACQWARITS